MVIFHSYVKLPEGRMRIVSFFPHVPDSVWWEFLIERYLMVISGVYGVHVPFNKSRYNLVWKQLLGRVDWSAVIPRESQVMVSCGPSRRFTRCLPKVVVLLILLVNPATVWFLLRSSWKSTMSKNGKSAINGTWSIVNVRHFTRG